MSGVSFAVKVQQLDKEEMEARQRRRAILRAEAERRDREAREAAFQRLWGWKEDGRESLNRFKSRFIKVKNILEPHDLKKKNIQELKSVIKRAKLHNENTVPLKTLFRSAKLLARAAKAKSNLDALKKASKKIKAFGLATQRMKHQETEKLEVRDVLDRILQEIELDAKNKQQIKNQDVVSVIDSFDHLTEEELNELNGTNAEVASQGQCTPSKDEPSMKDERDGKGAVSDDDSCKELNPFVDGQYSSTKDEPSMKDERDGKGAVSDDDSCKELNPFVDGQYSSTKDEPSMKDERDGKGAVSDDDSCKELNPFVDGQYSSTKDEPSMKDERDGKGAVSDDDSCKELNPFVDGQYSSTKDEPSMKDERDGKGAVSDDDSCKELNPFVDGQYSSTKDEPSTKHERDGKGAVSDDDSCKELKSAVRLKSPKNELSRAKDFVSRESDEVNAQIKHQSSFDVKKGFSVGDRVAGNYGYYGHWYGGVIVRCQSNGLYSVQYDDGDYEDDVNDDALQLLSAEQPEKVSNNKQQDFNKESNRTSWEDTVVMPSPALPNEISASSENEASKSICVQDLVIVEPTQEQSALELDSADMESSPRINLFSPGDAVICNFANQGQWCPAKIASSKPGGFYDIEYLDGDFETNREENVIMEIPDGSSSITKYDFQIGYKVLGNYKGKGIWFEGEIVDYKGGGDIALFDIEYIDGELEKDVSFANVVPLPGEPEPSDMSEPMLQIQGNEFISRDSNFLEGKLFKRMSQKIINVIKPFHLRTKRKSAVIQFKQAVLRQIFKQSCIKRNNDDPSLGYDHPLPEHIGIKPMEDAHSRRIPLSPARLMLLKMLRNQLNDAKATYQRTTSGIAKCEFMLECKSIFHYKLTGCPKCGVIFINDEMHINTFDRATGAPVMYTREHEVELLSTEVVVHKKDFEEKLKKLRDFESEIREKIVFDIQAWWACRLARRRALKRYNRVQKSMFFFRIRRLLKLKRAVDNFDPEKQDMHDLEYKFCDLMPELREYRLYKKARALKIAKLWGLKLLERTRTRLRNTLWREQKMARLREEERLERQMKRNEEMRVAEELRQDLRAVAEDLAKREWICPRFHCNRRKFLSKARYDTHMKVHRHMDNDAEAGRQQIYMRKMERLIEEEEIIRHIRAVKAGVRELGGDAELHGNPKLKNQRLTKGARPYMLVPQVPGEYRQDQQRKQVDNVQMRVSVSDSLESEMRTEANHEEEDEGGEVAKGRDAGNVQDVMTQLEVVVNLGATLTMFEKPSRPSPQAVVNPFLEQDRLEREAEEKRISDEGQVEHLIESVPPLVEYALIEEVVNEVFLKGYNELPPPPPVGYRRLQHHSQSSNAMTEKKKPLSSYGFKKIEKDLFQLELEESAESVKAVPTSMTLPPVNQADLQCRHDSDMSYAVTYKIHTGNRHTNKTLHEDYHVSFSNITNKPSPNLLEKSKSLHDSLLSRTNNEKVKTLREMSLHKLGSAYIEKQLRDNHMKEPDWLLMQHKLRLNESIQTEKLVTFEIVSMAKNIELHDTSFIMNKPIVRFGTLDACDYTIKCTTSSRDIKKERSLSKIHCMVYVPLISAKKPSGQNLASSKQLKKQSNAYPKSYDSDSSSDCDSDEEEERRRAEKLENAVTIVDNHSCWGTYVVSQTGVRKVPTTIQAGIPLEHGDLVCMGIVRNGPSTMTAIEANRALIVFRVRTDYHVTKGKAPEFDVGELIMSENNKIDSLKQK